MPVLSSGGGSVRLLLTMSMIASFVVIVSCRLNDDDIQRMNFVEDAEPMSRKSDDIKRPFGDGLFSRGRSYENTRSGQRSLTPWPMSKYISRRQTKRYVQPTEEADEWSREPYPVDKRPFGPGVYARPRTHRSEKRPFGGSMIFSRPRGDGNSKPGYRRYGYSRERREKRFEESPRDQGPGFPVSRDGWSEPSPDADVAAWLKLVNDVQRSRSLHRGGSSKLNYYDDDDDDDGLECREEQEDEDDGDEEKHQHKPEAHKPEMSGPPFESKRTSV